VPDQSLFGPRIYLFAALTGKPEVAASCQKRPDLLQARRSESSMLMINTFRLIVYENPMPVSGSSEPVGLRS
jgi:hypothetical protein